VESGNVDKWSMKKQRRVLQLNLNDLHFAKKVRDGKKEPVILGRGGYSTVYFAKWQEIPVAVKKIVLPMQGVVNANKAARFHHDVEMLCCLKHPNILTVYGSTRSSGKWYVVMEYMKSGDLHTLIQNRASFVLWEKKGDVIAKQIACGLVRI